MKNTETINYWIGTEPKRETIAFDDRFREVDRNELD